MTSDAPAPWHHLKFSNMGKSLLALACKRNIQGNRPLNYGDTGFRYRDALEGRGSAPGGEGYPGSLVHGTN